MDYQAKIANFYKRNRRMPTYAEIMTITGLKSKNAVFKLIARLREEGVIDKDSKGYLIPKQLFGNIRVLGTVEAGFPSPADEELIDTMTLDEWLIKNKEATYMLKAKGDSMIEAGIMEGDMILVDRSKEAKSGDIVIARLNDGWTVKYLKKKGNTIMLLPGNRKYKPIIPKEGDELEIAAVVTAIIRKYDER
jgi:repressor LexA